MQQDYIVQGLPQIQKLDSTIARLYIVLGLSQIEKPDSTKVYHKYKSQILPRFTTNTKARFYHSKTILYRVYHKQKTQILVTKCRVASICTKLILHSFNPLEKAKHISTNRTTLAFASHLSSEKVLHNPHCSCCSCSCSCFCSCSCSSCFCSCPRPRPRPRPHPCY